MGILAGMVADLAACVDRARSRRLFDFTTRLARQVELVLTAHRGLDGILFLASRILRKYDLVAWAVLPFVWGRPLRTDFFCCASQLAGSRHSDQASVFQLKLVAAPGHGVSRETGEPDSNRDQIAQRNQP